MRDETRWRQFQATDLLSANNLNLPKVFLLSGKPMAAHIKLEIIEELKRFLYLLTICDEHLAPSPLVGIALECFLASDNSRLIPLLGQRKLDLKPVRVSNAFLAGYRRSLDLREREFGAADPEQVWPSPFSLKLQILGWGALAAGVTLGIAAKVGLETQLFALPLLIFGGFLWFAEGPWPVDLPFRKNFVARLDP